MTTESRIAMSDSNEVIEFGQLTTWRWEKERILDIQLSLNDLWFSRICLHCYCQRGYIKLSLLLSFCSTIVPSLKFISSNDVILNILRTLETAQWMVLPSLRTMANQQCNISFDLLLSLFLAAIHKYTTHHTLSESSARRLWTQYEGEVIQSMCWECVW